MEATWGDPDALVFGVTPERPFTHSALLRRARTDWKASNAALDAFYGAENVTDAERFAPVGLHELRHAYASMMIAAGVNAKTLSEYMGHASIQITFDRYGHLLPGNHEVSMNLLDAYLDRADTESRLAQADGEVAA